MVDSNWWQVHVRTHGPGRMRTNTWDNMCLRQNRETRAINMEAGSSGEGHLDGDQMAHTALLPVSGPFKPRRLPVSQERAGSTNNQQSPCDRLDLPPTLPRPHAVPIMTWAANTASHLLFWSQGGIESVPSPAEAAPR